MDSKFEILIDSDGVIADFEGYVLKAFGKPMHEYMKEKSKFWKKVAWYNDNVKPFFSSLPKMKDADTLVDFCLTHFESARVLTATGHVPKNVGAQKTGWYEKHYPHLEVILVRKSDEKAKYAHEKAILVDDRMKSIHPWREAGGIGILHKTAKQTITELEKILGK